MTRNKRTRRMARKERKATEVEVTAKADEAYAEQRRIHPPTDFSTIRRILLTATFRSHEKGGYQPFTNYVLGPTVKASNPEELENATNEFYVDSVLGEPEN